MIRLLPGLAAASLVLSGLPARADDDALALCRTSAQRYAERIATGDPQKVAAAFTETATLNAPEGIVRGREAIAAFDRSYVMPGVSQTVTPTHGERIGPALMCSGQYVVTFAPGFPMKQVGGNYTALHVKGDGDAWPHALLAYSYTPPPMPAASR